MAGGEDSKFVLQGATSNKFTDVFGCLDTIEEKHNAVEKSRKGQDNGNTEQLWKKEACFEDDVIDTSQKKRKDSDSKRDNRREKGELRSQAHKQQGGFRPPRGFPPKRRYNTPDYKLHPEKWKCYDLSDVDNSQMSDHSNRNAALNFLDDLKKQRENEADASKDNDEDMCGKVVFKRPKFSSNTAGSLKDSAHETCEDKVVNEKPRFTSGKMVMPEFTFGADNKNRKKKKVLPVGSGTVSDNKGGNITLGHLDDEGDEDEKGDAETSPFINVKHHKMKQDSSALTFKRYSGLDLAMETDEAQSVLCGDIGKITESPEGIKAKHDDNYRDMECESSKASDDIKAGSNLFKKKGSTKRQIRTKNTSEGSDEEGT